MPKYKSITVKVCFEFETDVSDVDTEFVDVEGFSKELAENELAYLIENNKLSTKDFSFEIKEKHLNTEV